MSDEKSQQEPSMEDILASIRRILSEDEAEDGAKQAAAPAAPAAPPPPVAAAPEPQPEPEPEPEPALEEEEVLELTDDMAVEDSPPELDMVDDEDFEPEPEPVQMAEPEPEPDPDFASLTAFKPEMDPEPRPMFAMPQRREPEPVEDEALLSPSTNAASTTALAELARAVARERGIGLGNGGVTIEEMVREILKPILRDWLDQNLPYMIERMVRKEIERMVSRAEKL